MACILDSLFGSRHMTWRQKHALSKIDGANEHAKNIEEAPPVEAFKFLSGENMRSFVAGGDAAHVAKMAGAYANRICRDHQFPALILHEHRADLEQLLLASQASLGIPVTVIGRSNPVYDPCAGKSPQDIVTMFEKASRAEGATPLTAGASLYIETLASLLQHMGAKVSLGNLAGAPHSSIVAKVGELEASGVLNQTTADKMRLDIQATAADRPAVQHFLGSIVHSSNIFASGQKGQRLSLTDHGACQPAGIVSMDLSSFVHARAALTVIAAEIDQCAYLGTPLNVIALGSSLAELQAVTDVLKASPVTPWAIFTPEALPFFGDQASGLAWLSGSEFIASFAQSAPSAALLAEALGTYTKTEATVTKSSAGGWFDQRLPQYGDTMTTSTETDHRVSPAEITQLPFGYYVSLESYPGAPIRFGEVT